MTLWLLKLWRLQERLKSIGELSFDLFPSSSGILPPIGDQKKEIHMKFFAELTFIENFNDNSALTIVSEFCHITF